MKIKTWLDNANVATQTRAEKYYVSVVKENLGLLLSQHSEPERFAVGSTLIYSPIQISSPWFRYT